MLFCSKRFIEDEGFMIGASGLFLHENILQSLSMLQHCILLFNVRRN